MSSEFIYNVKDNKGLVPIVDERPIMIRNLLFVLPFILTSSICLIDTILLLKLLFFSLVIDPKGRENEKFELVISASLGVVPSRLSYPLRSIKKKRKKKSFIIEPPAYSLKDYIICWYKSLRTKLRSLSFSLNLSINCLV